HDGMSCSPPAMGSFPAVAWRSAPAQRPPPVRLPPPATPRPHRTSSRREQPGRDGCSRQAQLSADLLWPVRRVESVSAEQRERDALKTEPEAGRVRARAVLELDPVCGGEVLLVVVEGGEGRRLGAGYLGEDLELELLRALAGGEHPAATPEEGVRGDVELDLQPDAAEQLEGALAPGVAPRANGVRFSDPNQLALVEHLKPGRILRRLAPEDVGASRVDRSAPGRQPAAGGDRGVDRVACRRRKHEI